jgi:hypothetical protein
MEYTNPAAKIKGEAEKSGGEIFWSDFNLLN